MHNQVWRNAGEVLTVVVRDTPQPQGSKKGFPVIRRNGKLGVNIVSDNHESLDTWRGRVIEEARKAMASQDFTELQFPVARGVPVGVEVTFTLAKPVSEPKRKRTWPVRKPDLDKQKRAVGDALTAAGVYTDDSQVVDSHEYKDWVIGAGERVGPFSDRLETPGVVIRVWVVREESGG